MQTLFIERGSPWENGYIESFNGKLRDELLNREIFYTLKEAKVLIENWRWEYNHFRPHSALGYRPPAPEAIEPQPLRLIAGGRSSPGFRADPTDRAVARRLVPSVHCSSSPRRAVSAQAWSAAARRAVSDRRAWLPRASGARQTLRGSPGAFDGSAHALRGWYRARTDRVQSHLGKACAPEPHTSPARNGQNKSTELKSPVS